MRYIHFVVLSLLIYGRSIAQNSFDSIPPPPALPYLLIDWNAPSVRRAKDNGIELLDIKVFHCGENINHNRTLQTARGDTLIISNVISANCCNEFVGRISSNWGEALKLELYTIGNSACFCHCLFRFEYTLRMESKELLNIPRYWIFNSFEKKLNDNRPTE